MSYPTSSTPGTDVSLADSGGLFSGIVKSCEAFFAAVRTATVLKASTTLTVASGAITVTQGVHRVETEASAATDDLDTISGGVAGQFIKLAAVAGTRITRIRHGVGNIEVPLTMDVVLDSSRRFVELYYDGSIWYVLDADGWITNELAAPAASVTLTIPATGVNLEIECSVRSTTTGATIGSGKLQVNGDTTAGNYHTQWTTAVNGAAATAEATSQVFMQHPTADCVFGYFGWVTIKFPLFRRTDRQKMWITDWAHETAALNQTIGSSTSKRQGAGVVGTLNDAITSIVILPAADSWATGSIFRFRTTR